MRSSTSRSLSIHRKEKTETTGGAVFATDVAILGTSRETVNEQGRAHPVWQPVDVRRSRPQAAGQKKETGKNGKRKTSPGPIRPVLVSVSLIRFGWSSFSLSSKPQLLVLWEALGIPHAVSRLRGHIGGAHLRRGWHTVSHHLRTGGPLFLSRHLQRCSRRGHGSAS